jgi:hypothetical protein
MRRALFIVLGLAPMLVAPAAHAATTVVYPTGVFPADEGVGKRAAGRRRGTPSEPKRPRQHAVMLTTWRSDSESQPPGPWGAGVA